MNLRWRIFVQIAFIIILYNFKALSTNTKGVCSKYDKVFDRNDNLYKQVTRYYCCRNYAEKEGMCRECPVGFISTSDQIKCVPCPDSTYGKNCAKTCNCKKDKERCDHVLGCVIPSFVRGSVNMNGIIYSASIGALVLVICLLSGYIFYWKKFKNNGTKCEPIKSSDEGDGSEVPPSEQNKNVTYRFENDYEEIDENLILDIVPPSEQKKSVTYRFKNEYEEIDENLTLDVVPHVTPHSKEQDENSLKHTSNGYLTPYHPTTTTDETENIETVNDENNTECQNQDDRSSGYLHPYQPIISTDVLVHEYTSTQKNVEEEDIHDDENKLSGYLNPYQPIIANDTDVHEYTTTQKNCGNEDSQ